MISSSIFKSFLFLFAITSVIGNTAQMEKPLSYRDGLPNIATNIDNQIKLYADALFWYVSQQSSSIWATIGSSSFDPLITDRWEGKNISFSGDWGWRIGGGYVFPHDQWDTKLGWSWFRTEADSTIGDTSALILPQFFGAFVNGDHPLNGHLKWRILYNMIDWELGRSFLVSKRLSLRPFIGVKGGWIYQRLNSDFKVDERDVSGTVVPVDYIGKENLRNNFWGIGPSGGVQTAWTLTALSEQSVKLLGDFSTAYMWGTWSFKDIYTNDTPYKISTNVKDRSLGALSVHGFLGIGWEKVKNTTHISTKLGYEAQVWLNQVRFPTFQQILLHGNLTLQGGTFRVQIDF